MQPWSRWNDQKPPAFHIDRCIQTHADYVMKSTKHLRKFYTRGLSDETDPTRSIWSWNPHTWKIYLKTLFWSDMYVRENGSIRRVTRLLRLINSKLLWKESWFQIYGWFRSKKKAQWSSRQANCLSTWPLWFLDSWFEIDFNFWHLGLLIHVMC